MGNESTNMKRDKIQKNGGEDWETVVDFSKIHKEGVPAREVLSVLKELHSKE